jgi:hypothetical protein
VSSSGDAQAVQQGQKAGHDRYCGILLSSKNTSRFMGLQDLRTNFPRHNIGNAVDHQRIKVRAFHDHDILVIDINDPCLSWADREYLKMVARKKFGEPAPRRDRR